MQFSYKAVSIAKLATRRMQASESGDFSDAQGTNSWADGTAEQDASGNAPCSAEIHNEAKEKK
jgi:hypothetical protein